MKYFFVLGRESAISFAEILAVLGVIQKGPALAGVARGLKPEYYSSRSCVLSINQPIDVDFLIHELGGTIKIGEVVEVFNEIDLMRIKKIILATAEKKLAGQKDKKLFFGLSDYGVLDKKKAAILGLEIKKQLAAVGVKSRLVTSRDAALSSVVVKTNKLLSARGLEILLAGDGRRVWLARTLAVQPFDEFEKRDYTRPGRDAHSGMLPPKLAKIMLNLAAVPKSKTTLDPFCGSGTVLTEAALMGYSSLLGSDISLSAVTQTRENLEWILSQFKILDLRFKILNCDSRNLSGCYGAASIDAVVTEPYLGPPLKGNETPVTIEKIIKELSGLYLASLKEIYKVLKPGGAAVMVWPVFRLENGARFLPLTEDVKKIGFNPESLLPGEFRHLLNHRGTLVYARPDQKIGREIIKLKKSA